MTDRRILVGVVGAPHGVRGEVKLKSYTDVPMSLADYPVLWAGRDTRRLVLSGARPLRDDMLVARFEGDAVVSGVRLEGGEVMATDLVLVAAGAAPEVQIIDAPKHESGGVAEIRPDPDFGDRQMRGGERGITEVGACEDTRQQVAHLLGDAELSFGRGARVRTSAVDRTRPRATAHAGTSSLS